MLNKYMQGIIDEFEAFHLRCEDAIKNSIEMDPITKKPIQAVTKTEIKVEQQIESVETKLESEVASIKPDIKQEVKKKKIKKQASEKKRSIKINTKAKSLF